MAGSGFTVGSDEHLVRSQLWSSQIKELLMDDLFAMKFVKTIEEFPDGSLINIPSIGEAETSDFSEGQSVKYNRMDTGNFQFQFTQYKYSANSVSEKFKRDSFYAERVISSFVPRQHRALMEAVEVRVLSRGNAGQTASDLNTWNGADHRWVGGGSSDAIAVTDFAKAAYALRKAKVPMSQLCAVLDPSVAYSLQTQTNLVNFLSPVPQWNQLVSKDAITGFKFVANVFGFDCYVSNYLPSGISETVDGNSITNGVANQFFSAAPGDTLPIIGGFRQMPTVYSEFNKDTQETEYLTIAEYDFALYRPENMVVVLTDTTIV
jgi:hypothetical protein